MRIKSQTNLIIIDLLRLLIEMNIYKQKIIIVIVFNKIKINIVLKSLEA